MSQRRYLKEDDGPLTQRHIVDHVLKEYEEDEIPPMHGERRSRPPSVNADDGERPSVKLCP